MSWQNKAFKKNDKSEALWTCNYMLMSWVKDGLLPEIVNGSAISRSGQQPSSHSLAVSQRESDF